MPNWNAGILRIRGKREDVIKFLTEGVNAYEFRSNGKISSEYLPISKDELYTFDDDCIEYKRNNIYVEGTTRGFICEYNCLVYISNDTDNEGRIYTYVDYRQAWGINENELADISAKYHLDFRIFAAEAGMGFWIDLEILDGEITKLEEYGNMSYNEYIWNCPIPNVGG